jgi:hypothetical protein
MITETQIQNFLYEIGSELSNDQIKSLANKIFNEHNSGMKSGYNGALRAVRAIDRQIEYPASDLNDDLQYKIIYNTQKDLLYKIYQAIKDEKDEYTDD